MKSYNRFIFVGLFSSFFLFSFVSEAFACRCMPTSFSYKWNKSDTVFIGKVIKIEPLYKYILSAYDDKPVEVTFSVGEYLKVDKTPVEDEDIAVIKGDDEESFVLNTSLQNLTCMGYPFKEEEQYLVYAYKRTSGTTEKWSLYEFPSDTYGVGGLCGGTKLYKNSREEMKLIRVQVDEDMKIFLLNQKKEKKK